MTPELPSPSPLPALPVRRREILEILDTALKLYRRYFWVLIGWSALISSLSLVPIVNWLAIFASPLLFGAVSCCVAAAVRGQSVKFSQCWAFTKPRYGPLLGTLLLSYLVLIGVILALYVVGIIVGLLGAWALSNAPQPLQIVGAIVGVVLALIGFSVMGVGAFGWMSMVPIVVCLEDDKRSTAAMGRAFDLLKGNWRRVFGLSLILGLAVMAVFTLVGMIYVIFGIGGAGNLFSSNPSQSAVLGAFASIAGFMGVFFMIWNPVQTLVIAVLYLDLRVRREALDLEWTAYASTPAAPPNSDFAPLEANNSGAALRVGSPFGEEAATPASPASFGARTIEPANPYLAPTPFTPQNAAPTPAQVPSVQVPSVQVPSAQVPSAEVFSPSPDLSTFAENNAVINPVAVTNETSSSVDVAIPTNTVFPAENVFSADAVSPVRSAPSNNFVAPDTFPSTSSFSPPSSAASNNVAAPDVTSSTDESPPNDIPGSANEARRD